MLAPGYFFLGCCLLACSLCRAPDGLDPAPMEKEGVDGEPKGDGALKPCTGVPGVPNGMGPTAALWPKAGVDVPKAGLSLAAAEPKLKPGVCVGGLLEMGVPNWAPEMAAPKLKPPLAGWAGVAGLC